MKDNDRSFVRLVIVLLSLTLTLALVLLCMSIYKISAFTPNVDTDVPFVGAWDGGIYADATADGSAAAEDSIPEYIRQDELYTFLLLGVDRAAGLADTVILASIDTESGNIALMQIPRDTYIEVDGEGRKINSLLPLCGACGMADILERSLCLNIDRTAVVDLDALGAVVDAVGGVEIYVPFDMKYSDPYQDLYIDLKEGLQVLDGDGAQQFVRYRSEYADGDLGRVDAQKDFLEALFLKIKTQMDLGTVKALINSLLPMLETDVSAEEAIFFASCFFSGSERELEMLTVPGRQLKSEELKTWYYVISREGTLSAINTYFNVYGESVGDALFDRETAFCRDDEDFKRIYLYSITLP